MSTKNLSYSEKRRILRKKEIRLQKELRGLIVEGLGNSSYFWVVKNNLNRIQYKAYKLSCKPIAIIKNATKEKINSGK